ncbi:hypothetical protein QJS10_CPB14g00198 [Acorus calamus]|uniref:Secreted protein n=1 Tax=Acorus calamus TaxID=4465 RepID=A0AAV9D9H1_ACOCL|nr:hypothetical protein QJS10_CPB14g00198 [Acorus calamus]
MDPAVFCAWRSCETMSMYLAILVILHCLIPITKGENFPTGDFFKFCPPKRSCETETMSWCLAILIIFRLIRSTKGENVGVDDFFK